MFAKVISFVCVQESKAQPPGSVQQRNFGTTCARDDVADPAVMWR